MNTRNRRLHSKPILIATMILLALLTGVLGVSCANLHQKNKKYGIAIGELQAWATEAAAANRGLIASNERMDTRLKSSVVRQQELREVADTLIKKRREDSEKLDRMIAGLERIEKDAKALRESRGPVDDLFPDGK
jgi:hypothetical protein